MVWSILDDPEVCKQRATHLTPPTSAVIQNPEEAAVTSGSELAVYTRVVEKVLYDR